MDGLDVYIDDYSKPDPIDPDIVRQMVQGRYIFDPPPTRINAQGHVEDVPAEEIGVATGESTLAAVDPARRNPRRPRAAARSREPGAPASAVPGGSGEAPASDPPGGADIARCRSADERRRAVPRRRCSLGAKARSARVH